MSSTWEYLRDRDREAEPGDQSQAEISPGKRPAVTRYYGVRPTRTPTESLGALQRKLTRRSLAVQPPAIAERTAGRPVAAPAPATARLMFAPGTFDPGADAVQRQAGADATADQGPDTVHQLAAAGAADAGQPLPHGDRIQQSFGDHDLSGVRAHVGEAASSAAQAIGAEAYATGDHVVFDGAPDLHTAAHEAAHVVQQRHGVSLAGGVGHDGDAYEKQADAAADAVVRGESAAAVLGASAGADPGGAAVQRRVKTMHDTARVYATHWEATLFSRIANHIQRLGVEPNSPYVVWGKYRSPESRQIAVWTTQARGEPSQWEGFSYGFALEMKQMVGFSETWVEEILRPALLPAKLYDLVDRGRLLDDKKTATDDDGVDRPTGPSRWYPDIAVYIADALADRLRESFARVVPRYVAARAALAPAPDPDTGRRPPTPLPSASDIAASHMCDRIVARVLCEREWLGVDIDCYLSRQGGTDDSADSGQVTADKVIWTFALDPKTPNWIHVAYPPNASTELVSEAVFGTSEKATTIMAQPPMYGLSHPDALQLRRARGLPYYPDMIPGAGAAGDLVPYIEDGMAQANADRDPARDLLASGMADWAALQQAGGPAELADRDACTKSLERSVVQLGVCLQLAAPFGFQGRVAAVQAQLSGRLSGLAAAPIDEIAKWQRHASMQQSVVFAASVGLQNLGQHLQKLGVGKPEEINKVPPYVRTPLTRVASMYVDALELSHLVETARARLAAADTQLQIAPIETLELMLADIQAKIDQSGEFDDEHQPGWEDSTYNPKFDVKDADKRETDLRAEVSEVRALILAGDPAGGKRLQSLFERVESMQLETNIALNYAVFDQLGDVFYKLKWDNWSIAAQQSDDADHWSRELGWLAWKFNQAWRKFKQGEKKEAQQDVDDILKDPDFHTVLKRAYAELDDIGTKVAITKIAAIIGITLVSMGVGSAVGGVATGFELSATGTFVASAAAEAATFTALDAAVFGNDDVAGSFISDFAFNLATFGMLRAWEARKVVKGAGEVIEHADDAVKLSKLRGYIIRGKEVTGQGLIIAATTYAQMQFEQLRQTGRTLSVEDMQEMARQGLAMFIGVAVGGRIVERELKMLERAGVNIGARANEYAQLRKLAKQAEISKSPELAVEVLRKDRQLLQLEIDDLETQHLARHGQPSDWYKQRRQRDTQHLDMLEIQLTFDEIVPGKHYLGSEAQVKAQLAKLEGTGADITHKVDAGGRESYVVVGQKRSIELHIAQHGATASGAGRAAGPERRFPTNAVAGYARSPKEGKALMRRLAAGDRSAADALGMALPEGMTPNSVEWGLGRDWAGNTVIVIGDGRSVNWDQFPGIVPIGHSHPAGKQYDLRGLDEAGTTTIAALIQRDQYGDIGRLLPSASDLAVMARNKIKGHVVSTPYPHKGDGKIGNPAHGGSEPTVEFVIERSKYIGRWDAADNVGVYEARVRAVAGGKTLWKGKLYGVDAGASIVSFTKPDISRKRLPEPKPDAVLRGGDALDDVDRAARRKNGEADWARFKDAYDGRLSRDEFLARYEQGMVYHKASDTIGVWRRHDAAPAPLSSAARGIDPGQPLTTAQANALPPPNRGLIFVLETVGPPNPGAARSPARRRADEFEAATTGARSDVATGGRVAPALRYDNPNSNGNNFIRFDGIEGSHVLLDAKTRLLTFESRGKVMVPQKKDLIRMSAALDQNPSYRLILEFPTTEARREAARILRQLGIDNIQTRVRQ